MEETELQKHAVLRLSNEASNKLTRECLRTALMKLMEQKPYDQISITEIIKKAGVSRTAFYRNYGSKDELIAEITNEVTDAVTRSVINHEFEKNPKEWYESSLQYISDNRDTIYLLLQADMFRESILGKENIRENIFDKALPIESKEEIYRYTALQGALVMVILRWLVTGMNESVPFMAEQCEQLHYQILGKNAEE